MKVIKTLKMKPSSEPSMSPILQCHQLVGFPSRETRVEISDRRPEGLMKRRPVSDEHEVTITKEDTFKIGSDSGKVIF